MHQSTLLIVVLGVAVGVLGTGCHAHKPGHVPPGQMQKQTGYNPASGKYQGIKGNKGHDKRDGSHNY